MERYFDLFNVYPEFWNTISGQILVRGDKEIGIITRVKNYDKEKQLIIGDNERFVSTKWIKEGKYSIKNFELSYQVKNILINEIKKLEAYCDKVESLSKGSDINFAELEERLEYLNNKKKPIVKSFISKIDKEYLSYNNKNYKNHCWKCKSEIDSNKNKFCIECGWYKCSYCSACACNYTYKSNKNIEYYKFLNSNYSVNSMKGEINIINDEILQILERYNSFRGNTYESSKSIWKCEKKIKFLKQFINL